MPTRLFTNNAAGKLNANILAGDTALTLQAGQGALFPNPTGGDFFTFTIINNSNVLEICKCTARTGDVFTTIVRGQEGTSAIGFTAADRVELRLTASGIRDKQDRGTIGTITGNITLTGVDTFQEKIVTAAANVVLPLSSDAKLTFGDWIDFKIRTGGAVTLAPQGADLLDGSGSGSPISLANLDSLRAIVRAAGNWEILFFKPATANIQPQLAQGRLTLSTGVAVPTADVTAAPTVYFTPYGGNRIATFNGASWNTAAFTEKNVTVPATTSLPFDVFIVDGTLALETVNWTNDTTRATGITLQDGVYVKSGDATRRYLGTCRTTTVSGQCEDSVAKRYLWNYHNRRIRPLSAIDTTDNWSYGTAAFRQANGSAANQVEVVIGVSEDPVLAIVTAVATSNANNAGAAVGIGVDSSTVNSARINAGHVTGNNATAVAGHPTARYNGFPGIGKHDLRWLENGGGNTVTWYGDNGTIFQTGIEAEVLA